MSFFEDLRKVLEEAAADVRLRQEKIHSEGEDRELRSAVTLIMEKVVALRKQNLVEIVERISLQNFQKMLVNAFRTHSAFKDIVGIEIDDQNAINVEGQVVLKSKISGRILFQSEIKRFMAGIR